MVVTVTLQFLVPSVILKLLLDHSNNPQSPESRGFLLLLALFLIQLLRNVTWNIMFNIGTSTAVFVQGACQYLGFSKLLRLKSPGDNALGQLVTFCTGDYERINEAVFAGVLLVGAPFMFVMSVIYAWYLVGPMSLVGAIIILLFYPLTGAVAATMSRLRARAVPITDRRVGQMNEIISAIRLIKMYAWEQPFRDRVKCIRAEEMRFLQGLLTYFTRPFYIRIYPQRTL